MRKLCILILSILFLCTGCQKTPEAPIVVGKDQQQMIEKAQEVVSYATDTPTAGVDWAARLGAPEKYETKLTSAGGHLVVDVDAKVILPEVEMPVVRVTPTCSPMRTCAGTPGPCWGRTSSAWTPGARTAAPGPCGKRRSWS